MEEETVILLLVAIGILLALSYIALMLHFAIPKFNSALSEIEKHLRPQPEDDFELAFGLYKETHGALPVSVADKVDAIKEMRQAMQ